MDSSRSECPICHKEMTKYNVRPHLRTVHNLSPGRAGELMAQKKKTELESQGKQAEMCNECGAAFSTRRGLTIHLNSKHRGTVDVARTAEQESHTPTLKCCLCEGAFKTQEELSQHCGREHTEDSERPQDYTVHRMSFPKFGRIQGMVWKNVIFEKMDSSRSECPICHKEMTKYNVRPHLRTVHNLSPGRAGELMAQKKKTELESQGKQAEMCNECGAAFSTRRGLTIHLNSKHRGTVDVARTAEQESHTPTLKCCLCEGAFKTQEELSQHCGREHTEDSERPQDYTVHRMSFSSSEEYKEWFGRMCEVHCSSFFCRSSGANQKKLFMRSDNSYILDDTVSVVACFGHIGHDLDPALLRWTDDQIEYLKLMLQEFSTDYIVHKMRKDHESKDSKLYFITKRDLWNIMAKYNLNPGQRDRDDLTSLRMREEESNPDDGIRFFKMPDDPTGKGFVLVIITPLQQKWLEQYGHRGISVDDTHNVTRYALKLATVMVVDERDRGLPAGPEKIKQWAAFERRGVVMSTSMFGERWHLRIKQEKLKRKANARVDYVADVLIKAVEELAVEFEITDRRQLSSSFRVRENNVQHRLAVQLYKGNMDSIHKIGDMTWNVDATTTDTVYRVEFDEPCTCPVQANTHCARCHVCPYTASCSCRAGALAGVACAHSHAVKLYGSEPVMEPPVYLSLESEPRELELRHTERELRPLRDASEISNTMERFQSYALINAKVNALVRQGNDSALESLSMIAERMSILANDINVPLRGVALIARPDVPLTGGRPQLERQELYTVRLGFAFALNIPCSIQLQRARIRKQFLSF
ncbi:zinc finger, C2H2 type [Cooperia oncophora]